MRILFIVIICIGIIASYQMCLAGEELWNLVWQDEFDRTDVGNEWIVVRGKASVQEGRLLLQGGGATMLTQRTFKPDVRFEFDVEAMPGLPPCDLSATVGANKDHGYGYLLAFGGHSNQVNQLLGRGIRIVDKNPPFVIEHGKKYHIVAQLEGKRITYTVNGQTILDGKPEDPALGPGFDRVGLVTWAGMYVDNFKVYERTVPHPDTPVYPSTLPEAAVYREGRQLKVRPGYESPELLEAVKVFNTKGPEEALALFRKMGNTTTGLTGQSYVLGDLYYQEKLQFTIGKPNIEFKELADRLSAASKANPDDKILEAYARAAESLPELVMNRKGLTAAVRLTALGPENNPFYHKARLYEARYHYWNGAEAGNQQMKEEASDWMAVLKETWPENTVLKQYTGEEVPWGEELIADTGKHPEWAAYLREAYSRQIRIMERFFTERQSPDGQLGGGWGDDVELMRTWMQIASISSAAEVVRAGIEKLADGVWKYELKNGYAKNIGDVEHSAEPSADTLPTMLLLRYGDPLWVERNMQSCKTIRDVCMGIDRKGYPRFKSVEIGAEGVNSHPRAGGDTGYHARAMKHYIWQAWWGDRDARDWFAKWCDGWYAATMAQIGTKIPGTPPPTIWYPSGDIYPPVKADWCDRGWNYYGNMGGMIYDSFLCAYYLTKDPKYLKAFQLAMDNASYGPMPEGKFADDSKEAQLLGMIHMPDSQKTATYKWLTGERVYDEYTRRFGEPAQIYRINYDLESYLNSFRNAAISQRYNLEMQTTEVLSTDRASLDAALTVFGAYTGAVSDLRDAATPTFAVTYDTPSTNFSAIVIESTPKRLRVWLYNFEDKPMRVGLKLWQLIPGNYILNQGETVKGEHDFQHRYNWIKPRNVKVLHRADTVYVNVASAKVWTVDLRLDTPIAVPQTAPDLAISARDVVRTDKGLTVKVHNIGNADSRPSIVTLKTQKNGNWITVSKCSVPSIPAPRNFTPQTTFLLLPSTAKLPPGSYKITVDPEDKQYEIYEQNNSCEIKWL